MVTDDKRKYPRVSTSNHLTYSSLDGKGGPAEQGVGVTIDIGQGGILMDTKSQISSRYVLITANDLEQNTLRFKGEVIYCRKGRHEKFHCGIRFIEHSEKNKKVVSLLIRSFLQTKSNQQAQH